MARTAFSSFAELPRRALSAAVIAPPALAAVWFGGYWLLALALPVAFLMGLEWGRLVGYGGHPWLVRALAIAAPQPVLALLIGGWPIAALHLLLLAGALYALAGALDRDASKQSGLWYAAGLPAIGLPVLCLVWLRAQEPAGAETVLWLVALVIATDIGAYFCGRLIGGPKLMPRISPKKTWAGLVGGMAAAACIGALATTLVAGDEGRAPVMAVALLSALLAVVAQTGDLAESAVKRNFNVKDSGTLIPGHGGLFDRLDGFLITLPALALLVALTGMSVLQWQ
ncbi:phosphatidate cytidylyltransferase [Oceanibaculum nanhaiense]|uniref:phosphatidate cytidylyltransferase n=1 Tax=Oceanibaculum nanhaiense TaxID=1909734 RepID=UPI001FEAA342|nr:phosphatidate cytidylyltransferase [Oceanibaculum nanhaiense]